MKNTKRFWPIFSKNKLKGIYSRAQTPTSTSITSRLHQNEYPYEHSSHLYGIKALEMLYSNGILAICLPSHSTSILQPLDIGLFHPLKVAFRYNLQQARFPKGHKLNMDDLPELIEPAWVKIMTKQNMNNSTSSLHPRIRKYDSFYSLF